MNFKLTPFRQRYFLHLNHAAKVVLEEISQVVLLLSNKRQTFAEKAIKNELDSFAILETQFIAVLTESIERKHCLLNSFHIRRARQLNNELSLQLKAFLKAAEHNLNYLEQYFEHDFCSRLYERRLRYQFSEILSNAIAKEAN